MRATICGVGVNDSDYQVTRYEKSLCPTTGKIKLKQVWCCPYYSKWKGMIKRCYNKVDLNKQPTYSGCTVCDEWLTFSNFKAWMETQDWNNCHLDKDILSPGNKIYSPDFCVFVTPDVNTFLNSCQSSRGRWPVGVSYHKPSGKFLAYCQSAGRDNNTNRNKYLGSYSTPWEAHAAWLKEKQNQAAILAGKQTDSRVGLALIERYQNYHKHFPQEGGL